MALPVVLGSSSVFRQRQLAALRLDFAVGKPVFDEAPLAGESARDTALRLAVGKARSLARRFPWLNRRGVRGFRPSACTVKMRWDAAR